MSKRDDVATSKRSEPAAEPSPRSEGAPANGVRAVVAGHGDFAAGMISAVQQITGRGSVFRAVTARDLSAGAIEAMLRHTMDETGTHVVFTDLQAGSCTMAARKVLRDRSDALLVVGTNLPMLLDFVFADAMPPIDAARHALERGRAAMNAIGGGTGDRK
jgi:N-acetylgalactosamine PTS system EIIA component